MLGNEETNFTKGNKGFGSSSIPLVILSKQDWQEFYKAKLAKNIDEAFKLGDKVAEIQIANRGGCIPIAKLLPLLHPLWEKRRKGSAINFTR